MRGRRIAVVALGGNAVLNRGEEATAAQELANIERACEALVPLARDYDLIVTHGNGPQVGNILLRMEEYASKIPPRPLDVCVAQTQGEMGYFIQQALGACLRRAGLPRPVSTLVTQVVVDRNDPAFATPTKPIGAFLTRQQAQRKAREKGWRVAEDSGRGYRRVVPSPRPLKVVERATILALTRSGVIVVAAGGGGVPVVEQPDGRYVGVEAVIDKDLASGMLAREVGASLFVILTGVEKVFLDYNTPRQQPLSTLSASEAREHLRAGQFPPGSMCPKIQAALDFLDSGSGEVLITTPHCLKQALLGRTGTWITARERLGARRRAA